MVQGKDDDRAVKSCCLENSSNFISFVKKNKNEEIFFILTEKSENVSEDEDLRDMELTKLTDIVVVESVFEHGLNIVTKYEIIEALPVIIPIEKKVHFYIYKAHLSPTNKIEGEYLFYPINYEQINHDKYRQFLNEYFDLNVANENHSVIPHAGFEGLDSFSNIVQVIDFNDGDFKIREASLKEVSEEILNERKIIF